MSTPSSPVTVDLRARRASSLRGSVPAASMAPTTVATSPVKALFLDEVARTRRLSVIGMTLSVAACASTLVLRGDPDARVVLYAGMGLMFVVNLWLFWIAGDPSRYDRRMLAVVWWTGAGACVTAGLYFGIFSPAAAATLLGIYFISLGESFSIALGVFVLAAAGWGALGLLSITGVVADVGIVRPYNLEASEKIVGLALTEALYAAAFMLARGSRKATLFAMSELERAVRDVAQREALLFEAQRDLQQALQVGGPGRYTDDTLGSFRLGVVIGRGAMGEIYEATHVQSGAGAAVKVLPAHSLANPQHLQRFLREAEAVASLDTPHVVRVLETSPPDDPIPWIAMERLQGIDLAQLLRQERVLAPPVALELIEQIARGVDAATSAGVVHRDLKPQNLFRHERGGDAVWKILDFGVSKLADHGGTLTQGNIVGTPVYMAPEQALGRGVDHRADVYALAAVAYRALTGQPPFRGKDTPSILYRVVHHMPLRPSTLVELPPAVDAVLAVGLAKDSAARFGSARELAAALRPALDGALAPRLRQRADAVLARHPWSTLS